MRSQIRIALDESPPELSLTITVFSRRGEFTTAGGPDDLAVLVRTGPATDGPNGPLRLTVAEHERWLPSVKQVGESDKTYYLRAACEQGFDDAAFLDRLGRISEATIWNFAFWDGEAVIWPNAEVLSGVTMQIAQRQLKALGVPQRHATITVEALDKMAGAAVMNSWNPGIAVSALWSERSAGFKTLSGATASSPPSRTG